MIIDIGKILKAKLIGLAFVDRIAGVVQTASEREQIGEDKFETKKFPVSCDVTSKDCEVQNDKITDLIPNDSKKSVFYFEDIGGATFVDKRANDLNFTANIRLVGWLNLKLLGKDECSITSLVVANIIRRFTEQKTFNSSPFTRVNITVLKEVMKDPNIFAKYSYVESRSQYLMYPFDYFAIDFKVKFSINTECMETFEQGIIDDCNNF